MQQLILFLLSQPQRILSLHFGIFINQYNTFFWMKQEQASSSKHADSQQFEVQSNDSDEFQQLQQGYNQSIGKRNKRKEVSSPRTKNQQNLKTLKEQEWQQKVKRLQMQAQQRELQIENLRKENLSLKNLYQNYLKQTKQLEGKLQLAKMETIKIKKENNLLNEAFEAVKEQSQQYIDKIACLQKRYQLQKQDLDSKFTIIRKTLQKFTKSSIKCLDYQNTFKLLVNKLTDMQKLFEKLTQVQQMIVEKSSKSKTLSSQSYEFVQQKIKSLEKVQAILIKQQNKVNSLRDYIGKLEQEMQNNDKNQKSGAGIGKWLDPVIKFCKIEEGAKERQMRKKKQNV